MGEVRDTLQILSIPFNADYFVPTEYIDKMKEFEAIEFCENDLEEFFRLKMSEE